LVLRDVSTLREVHPTRANGSLYVNSGWNVVAVGPDLGTDSVIAVIDNTL
jgi:hypothetical protein